MDEFHKKEEELNTLKVLFISMISHEFRTPLSTIMLSTDLLKRYGDKWSEEEKLKHFNRIQATVLKMTKLMENVLLIGKMDMGKFVIKTTEYDLIDSIKSTIQNIESLTNSKHKIHLNYNEFNGKTIFDENIMGLILQNLISNSVKYMPGGGEVFVNVQIDEKSFKMELNDKGIGIFDEDMPHIFDYFFRGKNVGPIDGYGLGLAIVKRCLDVHSGKIEVNSKVNEGTTFKIEIPNNINTNQIEFKV